MRCQTEKEKFVADIHCVFTNQRNHIIDYEGKIMKKNLKIVKCFCKKVNKLCKKCKIWYNTNKEKQMFGVCKTKKKVEGEMMSAPYSAMQVAEIIISYCTKKNHPVTNLKLQKLLYFIWIEYYKQTKTYLFDDEFAAWQLGPVIPSVYYRFCPFAGNTICRTYETEHMENNIDTLIDKFLLTSARNLVEKSHRKGHSWDTIYKDGEGNRGTIPFSLIISKECTSD